MTDGPRMALTAGLLEGRQGQIRRPEWEPEPRRWWNTRPEAGGTRRHRNRPSAASFQEMLRASKGRQGCLGPPQREELHPHPQDVRGPLTPSYPEPPGTHLPLSLSLLVLQGEEVQVCHLQLHLAGFQEAADVPVDTCPGGGLDNVCRERWAVSEFFRGCSQCPPLTIIERKAGIWSDSPLSKEKSSYAPSSRVLGLGIWDAFLAPPPASEEIPGELSHPWCWGFCVCKWGHMAVV